MIPIVKPAAPDILLGRGVTATRQLCEAYESAPDDYNRGVKIFDFDSSIYAANAVKNTLREAQLRKCAFCESFFAHTGYGDVEHFRPKAGYKQTHSDELKRPGYYWLAYARNNLFYSCQLCNQRFKRSLFPLKDGRRRARSHSRPLDKEVCLLIDPSARGPAVYMDFREEYAYAVGGCHEGTTTIELLGLNRAELAELRRDRLARLKDLVLLHDLLREKVAVGSTPDLVKRLAAVEETLQASTESGGEYAAMARSFLRRADTASAGS